MTQFDNYDFWNIASTKYVPSQCFKRINNKLISFENSIGRWPFYIHTPFQTDPFELHRNSVYVNIISLWTLTYNISLKFYDKCKTNKKTRLAQ